MKPKNVIEKLVAYGHPNIQALHPTTLMFTKETDLSKNGDCIIAVRADKAVADFSSEFKEKLRQPDAELTVLVEVDGKTWQVTAKGSPKLSLTNLTEIVVRKSDFISDRTFAVHADKASIDMPRDIVEKLKNPKQKINVTFTVQS